MSKLVLRACLVGALTLSLFSMPVWAEPKPRAAQLSRSPVQIAATKISGFDKLNPSRTSFGRLEWLGGLSLSAASTAFGGWSGLVLDASGQQMLSVSDAGAWLTARLNYKNGRLAGIDDAQLGPLKALNNTPLRRGRDRDAEAVALVSGTLGRGKLLIAFEQNHRIGRFEISKSGLSAPSSYLRPAKNGRRMRALKGFEAMTVLKGGRYKGSVIAISERTHDVKRNHTGWIWTGGKPKSFAISDIGGFDITDVAALPDGGLLLLERRFRWLEGVKMRIRYVAQSGIKPGAHIKGVVLMEADLSQQIDNMEGIAVHRGRDGSTIVTLISDDNFNRVLQRTLLLQFRLKDEVLAAL